MKLFIFEHCPFCIKATMLAGYKNIDIEMVYLQNDDVDARIEKVGANMVPILQKESGEYMAESLDIVAYLDEKTGSTLKPSKFEDQLNTWFDEYRMLLNTLIMPCWTQLDKPLKEFQSEAAKDWFESNKSKFIGMSFEEARKTKNQFLPQINEALQELNFISLPSDNDNCLSYDDIQLYPFIRNLTVVEGVQFPAHLIRYVDEVTELTGTRTFYECAL
ncbi:glutaredoxin 2 [Vibrio sp.]|nr:glutaredoxin 2 [Vibrio sp.]